MPSRSRRHTPPPIRKKLSCSRACFCMRSGGRRAQRGPTKVMSPSKFGSVQRRKLKMETVDLAPRETQRWVYHLAVILISQGICRTKHGYLLNMQQNTPPKGTARVSVVEMPGFRNLIKTLDDPKDDLPDLVEKVLPEFYMSVREKLTNETHFSATMDLWSSRTCEPHLPRDELFCLMTIEESSLRGGRKMLSCHRTLELPTGLI